MKKDERQKTKDESQRSWTPRRYMRRGVLAAGLVVLMGLCARAGADDKVTLALKLEKGKIYDVGLTATVEQTQTLGKEEMKQTTTTAMTAQYNVEEVAGGVMTLRVTYKTMRMETEAAGQKVKGDSANAKGTTPADKMCAAVVGKSFTLDVDSAGSVKKVGGVKEFLDGVVDTLGKDWGVPRAVVLAQVQGMFNEKSMAQQFGAGMHLFPDHPVAVGETWVIKSPVEEGVPMGSETTFKLESVKDGIATVTSDVNIATPEGGAKGSIGGEQTVTKLSGKATGKMEMEVATGMTPTIVMSANISGTVTTTSPDGRTVNECGVMVKTTSAVEMKAGK